MAAYRVVTVDDWQELGPEPMGSKPDKVWLAAPPDATVGERAWLFKPVTIQHGHDRDYPKGADWAETFYCG
jgi:hypothetical protein